MLASLKFGTHDAPGFWQYVLPAESFRWKIPVEQKATCFNCPQIAKKAYEPSYRCCTFIPRVPNFLLGLALKNDAATALHIRKLINDGYVVPEGMQHTPAQWLAALESDAKGLYGKASAIKCPNLDVKNGTCRIYQFRNASCSTYFCEHDHDSKGAVFWDSLHAVLSRIEFRLSQFALEQMNFDFVAYENAFHKLSTRSLKDLVHQESKAWGHEARELLWGQWFQREEELLLGCAAIIEEKKDDLRELVRKEAKLLPLTQELAALPGNEERSASMDIEWDELSFDEAWAKLQQAYSQLRTDDI